jgi:phosphopantetheinyl transferase (holo-ACP synthase)
MNIYSFFSSQQRYQHLSVRLCQEEEQTLTLVDLNRIELAVQQHEPRLLQQLLSPAEQEYFQRFKYMKRKKEWLGGRLAVKAALLICFSAPDQALTSFTILPNKHGRPLIEEVPACLSFLETKPNISLSHNDDFAVALAHSQGICGLDLQEISTKLAGLTSYFAQDAELQLLAEQAGCDEDTRLTMLWTVKEALKKALLHDQSVIFSETELHELTRLNEFLWRFTCSVQGQPQSVRVHLLHPYVLSIAEEDTYA